MPEFTYQSIRLHPIETEKNPSLGIKPSDYIYYYVVRWMDEGDLSREATKQPKQRGSTGYSGIQSTWQIQFAPIPHVKHAVVALFTDKVKVRKI